jgi:hypothetical protein
MSKLIIFDLNGVLISKHGKNSVKLKNADIMLNYAFENYSVAIWSSAKLENVNKTLAKLLSKDQLFKLVFIFSQENCLALKGTHKYHPNFTKPLCKVWSVFSEYGPDNTLIIDDSIEKIIGYESNHLLPDDFLKIIVNAGSGQN